MFRFVFNRAFLKARGPICSSVSVAQQEPCFPVGIYKSFATLTISNGSIDSPMVAPPSRNSFGLSEETAFFASKCFKIQVLQSLGFSSNEIPRLMLVSSLEKGTSRAYERLKYILDSEADASKVVEQFPEVLIKDFENKVSPIIQILRQAGVTTSGIVHCLNRARKVLTTISDANRFEESVKRVKGMGINPERKAFVDAVFVMAITSEATWDDKVAVYKKCGWSAVEVSEAFKRHPRCMLTPESKVRDVFDLFVRKLRYDASVLARRPKIITLSLEETISPRCSVLHVLLSKGLVKNSPSPMMWLECTEERFFDKFVKPYLTEAPELLKVYQEKKWKIKKWS